MDKAVILYHLGNWYKAYNDSAKVISFITGAWHITWILFIIVVVVNKIVKLLFTLNDKEREIKEND